MNLPLVKAIVILPGTVLVYVPALIVWLTRGTTYAAHFPPDSALVWLAGFLFAAAGLTMMVWTMRLFALKGGGGTPAPWQPVENFIVSGPYRHVRNPMLIGANLLLIASQVPDGQFAYVIASRTQGFVANPGGSQGNLCILGNIARFNRAGEVGAIAGGQFTLQLPMTDIPEPPALGVTVLAGDTWNFQCWHRDFVNGMPTSNFTDGLSVQFQ